MTRGTHSVPWRKRRVSGRGGKLHSTYQVVQDLVADDPGHLEALLAGDRVHDHVAVDADEVLGVENAVFILKKGDIVSRPFLMELSA
jgi:hypothetical protein